MKKLFNLKEMLIISLIVGTIGITSSVFATDVSILADNNSTINTTNNTSYENLGSSSVNTSNSTAITNITSSNTSTTDSSNTVSNGVTTNSAYNTVDNDDSDDLPQTGIEDYNIGILLIICVGASIYTYKKMRDYRNI